MNCQNTSSRKKKNKANAKRFFCLRSLFAHFFDFVVIYLFWIVLLSLAQNKKISFPFCFSAYLAICFDVHLILRMSNCNLSGIMKTVNSINNKIYYFPYSLIANFFFFFFHCVVVSALFLSA